MSLIESHIENRVGYITLNHPEKRNALSPEMVQGLKENIQSMLGNDHVKIVVLKGNGPAFCSGADLGYLRQIREFTYEENLQDSQNLRALFDLVHSGDKIFISQVEGAALAGGCGLATICDFCFATPEAGFGYTEARIGFIPALVMVYLQQRLAPGKLRELVLTAKILNAQEALDIGLINKLIDAKTIGDETTEFAEKLAHGVSGQAVATIKKMLRELHSMSFGQGLDYAAAQNAEARRSADCMRGIDAFLNKEKINW